MKSNNLLINLNSIKLMVPKNCSLKYQKARPYSTGPCQNPSLICLYICFVIFILFLIGILYLCRARLNVRNLCAYLGFLNALAPLAFPFFRLVFFLFAIDIFQGELSYLREVYLIGFINWILVHLVYPILTDTTVTRKIVNVTFYYLCFCLLLSILLYNCFETVTAFFYLMLLHSI